MQSTIKKYVNKACALAAAAALCCSLAIFAFSRPAMPVKADDDISAVTEYFQSTFRNKMLTWGLTNIAGMPKNRAAAAVVGAQLGLLVVSENIMEYDPATIDMSQFSEETGFYIRNGSTYALTTCWNTHNNGADWYVGDRSPFIAQSTEGWHLRLAGDLDAVTSYYSSSSVCYQVRTDSSAGVECSASGIFSDDYYVYSASVPTTFYFHLRWQYGVPTLSDSYSIHDYVPGTRNDGRQIFGCSDGYTVSHTYSAGTSNLVDYYNDVLLPEITDDPIVQDYPELILFPDGIPDYEPDTTEPTVDPSGVPQPFTLPPEWLETYPIETETFAMPIPPDATMPPVEIDESTGEGLLFWKEYWESFMDDANNEGLLVYVYIIIALSVAEFVIWHVGSKLH